MAVLPPRPAVQRSIRTPVLLTAMACLLAVSLPPSLADDDREIRALAAAEGQGRPLLRIGLEAGRRILLTSSSSLRIVDPADGQTVWKPAFKGEVAIVTEGGPTEDVGSVFRVQVGAFGTQAAAEAERSRLEQRFGRPGVLRHDPDRGLWRVRLGEADDRWQLQPLMDRLRQAGIEQLWIAEEPAREYAGVTLRIVDASYDSMPTGRQRLVVATTGTDHVIVEDKPYRGVVELRVTPFGTVRAINWVELESYLLGVVPAELGPEVWPELEALKAQAVAARTYTWRNRGQFEEQGYDLCATPRCQVYEGVAVEHPLSDRAVLSTRGEILSWQGQPINAYYTATCGGHTENSESIFLGESAPYLRGVPCREEAQARASMRGALVGRAVHAAFDEAGEDLTRHAALLTVAGVLDRNPSGDSPLKPELLRAWTTALASLAGRPPPEGPPGSVETLGRAASSLVQDLGWRERASVLLGDADPPALLRDPRALELPADEVRALAYLAFVDSIRPFPDGAFHVDQRPSTARLLPALVRIGEAYQAFGLRPGVVARVKDRRITLVQGKGELKLRVAERPVLFGWTGGKPVPSTELELWPGDRVRFRTGPDGTIDFLELVPPVKGASDDRSAAVYSWEVRRTRHELERDINRRVSIGRLQELRVVRRGVSGRIIELEVVGSRDRATVRGFDVRRLLNLRESLTVVEPQRDAEGHLEAVVFAGKGWGHGVGLCQVGAYGMALRGSTYRQILSHYYQGARLQKISKARSP